MDFDLYKERYTRLVNKSIRFSGLTVDFFVRAKARHLIALAKRNFADPKRLRVLDVGCGAGSIHPHIINSLGPITGVDVAAETIELAKKANPMVRYQPYDGHKLPFEAASFDLAYAVCVLHHVPPPDWQGFVREMTRVTARDGLVVIFEHNPYNPLTRRAVRNCELDDDAVLLRASRVRELLKGAGLIRVRSRYILFAPVEGPLAAWLDGALGGLPAGAQYFVSANKV